MSEISEVTQAPAADTADVVADTPVAVPVISAPEEVQAVKPSLLSRAAAMIQTRGELLGQITGLQSEKTILTSKLSTAEARIITLERDLEGKTELEAALKKLEGEQKTVSQVAQDQVAALGFDVSKLPAAARADTDGDAPTSIEDFQKQHAELTQKDTDGAANFYAKYAKKFGL